MHEQHARLIEAWCADHDDGEFSYVGRTASYEVIGPSNETAPIIYTTKPRPVASAIYNSHDSETYGLIGRGGLPTLADVSWIRNVIANHKLYFLGDMDPPDLMIFAWLRANLHPKRIRHLGASDRYFAALHVCIPTAFQIAFSSSERKSLPVLRKVLPDMLEIVGPKCAELLKQGRKIELAAVVSTLESALPILRPVIDLAVE